MVQQINYLKYFMFKSKYFYWILIFGIVIPGSFYYGLYRVVKYSEAKDQEVFTTAYEIGRYDQLNESAEEKEGQCFNLSKNQALNILLREYFIDCKTAHTMYAIAQAESSGKQFAVGQNDNGSLDGGFFQINTIHKRKGETDQRFIMRMHNLQENIFEAKKVLDTEGYTAWTQYRNGVYLKFLK